MLRAETLRLASFNVELTRKGPGLLLRDIQSGRDKQVAAVLAVIHAAAPDVLVLQGFDHDLDLRALTAFRDALAAQGLDLPHMLSARPNSGLATGLDMDGDGLLGRARDSQGYGAFTGAGGMAVLSRLPLGPLQDYSDFLWRDLPGATLPTHPDGTPFPSAEAQAIQRLSSVAHWAVPVRLANGQTLTLLTWHGSTPAFDGPEDRNGKRGGDEARFWLRLLDGALPFAAPKPPFVLIGQSNIDPEQGEGDHAAMRELLADPRLQDPKPAGSAGLATADWSAIGVGKLRVSYILPWAGATIVDAGGFWPGEGADLAATAARASRHHLVWVDLEF